MSVHYVVLLNAEDGGGDCIPEFFDTLSDAIAAGLDEVKRVADLADDERYEPTDFAVSFFVYRHDGEGDGELVHDSRAPL